MRRVDEVSLEGAHVHLLPLRLEHAPLLLKAANLDRGSFALAHVPRSLEDMERYVRFALQDQASGNSLAFVVREVSGDVVGTTRFCDMQWWADAWPSEPLPPLPAGPDVVEIGWTWYAARVQRSAVNTEAKLLLCSHAFEVWRVRRILWKTDARNVRSRNAILRLGAKFDGVLRAHRPAADGLVRDSAYYSMLLEEWPVAKRALLAKLSGGSSLE